VVRLPAKSRGCHVITRHLLQQLPELQGFEIGLANLFSAPALPAHIYFLHSTLVARNPNSMHLF
jgi:hypothetical protein